MPPSLPPGLCPGPVADCRHSALTALLLVALCCLSIPAARADVGPADADRPAGAAGSHPATILVLGDSISAGYGIQRAQGWVERLRERLAAGAAPWQVINASISGETTGGGLARLPQSLADHDPEVVIIELGGNDGLRGYPVERIRANLAAMVRLARDAGCRVLLVGMQIPPNYGPRYASAFAGVFREVADAQQIALVPFLLESVALEPALMQQDGIHPTAEAQPRLLDTVWPVLQPLLETAAAGQAAGEAG